jgi:hypothetical protein
MPEKIMPVSIREIILKIVRFMLFFLVIEFVGFHSGDYEDLFGVDCQRQQGF